jgi:hypothetical protein
MGFFRRLINGRTILGALVGGGLLAAPGVAGAGDQLAQAKTKALLPSPAVQRAPTDVEIVNKAINPGASDPNVPLPRADLPGVAGTEAPATGSGPQIFGRSEDGGGVLGLKVPIPADRNASGATARYGAGQ